MTVTPTIDYTNKDFVSLRAAMLDLAQYRLPEWTDRSPADLGMLMIDLFAYMGDVTLYYQDRIANESFLDTAIERRSVLHLLRLIGYELSTATPATAAVNITFKPPPQGGNSVVVIPSGTAFTTKATAITPAIAFAYLGADLSIDLSSNQVAPSVNPAGKWVYSGLPVTQSMAVPTEVIASSIGTANLRAALSSTPAIAATLVVEVNEGAGWVKWDRRANLIYDSGNPSGSSGPTSRDYYLQFDENDVCYVCFGDGVNGMRPPVGLNNIRATYNVGGGAAGNVAASAISALGPGVSIALFDSVTNPQTAAGGADREDIAHAVSYGPLAFRSGGRAVTLTDYVALAQQAGGVAKVRGGSPSGNVIELYVAPAGDSLQPVPESMRLSLLSYFEDKRMAGVTLTILDANPAPIDVTIEVTPDRRYQANAVQAGVVAAIQSLLAYANVDFGQTLYLSDFYKAAEAVPGVVATYISQLTREQPSPTYPAGEAAAVFVQAAPAFQAVVLSASAQTATAFTIDGTGRIPIADFEIPVLGDLTVLMQAPA